MAIPHATVGHFSHLSRFGLHCITVWAKGRSWFVVTAGQYFRINVTGCLYKFLYGVRVSYFINPKSVSMSIRLCNYGFEILVTK